MQKKTDRTHQERIYLNHIRRLQEDNRVLSEMLVMERKARIADRQWYRNRVKSPLYLLIDFAYIMSSDLKGKRDKK